MDIQESEKAGEAVLKMDRIDRLYVRGGCTVDADGTRVCSFYLTCAIPPCHRFNFLWFRWSSATLGQFPQELAWAAAPGQHLWGQSG